LFKKAEALTNRKKYADAKEAVDKFCAKYPTSSMKSDADQLRIDIESKMIEEKAQKGKNPEPIKDTGKQVPHSGS
jgi:outer membrane protein assembly factor BamD (BamD/ComL family)